MFITHVSTFLFGWISFGELGCQEQSTGFAYPALVCFFLQGKRLAKRLHYISHILRGRSLLTIANVSGSALKALGSITIAAMI